MLLVNTSAKESIKTISGSLLNDRHRRVRVCVFVFY